MAFAPARVTPFVMQRLQVPVQVLNYAQLLMVEGWRIFLVIGLSTMMVLGATAWVVDKVYRYEVSRMKHE